MHMAISFLKNLLGVKANGVVQSGIEMYVKWDPKGASEAELKTMEGKLDQMGLHVAQARARYNEAQKALDTMNSLMHERMTAADTLQKQLDAESDPARKASLEKSLATLVDLLEKMTPEVDEDDKDAVSAHEFLEQLEAAYTAFGDKLKHARSDLDRAQREMERQRLTRDNAADRAEAARQAAGLSSSGSSVNVALEAMHAAAERDRVKAEANNAKAALLKPTVPEQDDPNIVAALAAAKGTGAPPTSLTDRLAALRSRAG
jgi:chromosome segregation ATPase